MVVNEKAKRKGYIEPDLTALEVSGEGTGRRIECVPLADIADIAQAVSRHDARSPAGTGC